jgi:hypothetical protein
VGPPASKAAPAPQPAAEGGLQASPESAPNGEARRSLSSFGAPKTGKKSSLLERLTEAGTIDEVMAIDEVSRNSQIPKAPEASLGLDRPFADLSEVSSGVPHAVLESLVPSAPDREEASLSAPRTERRSSVPPGALSELQATPVARVPTIRRALEPVREITAVRDPRRDPDDDFEPSRPSSERLSDADLQFVSEARDVSFVSALSQDPDVDEPPVVARFKRPPELPRNQPSIAPSAGSVAPPALTASPDSLTPPATPIALGAAALPPPLPSMMVSGTPAPARGDTTPTERMPLPRPANHSTAPTSVPKTDRPPERRSAMPWMLVAAAVLLGVGLAGLSRYRSAESQAEPVAVAAPSAVTPELEVPAPAPVEAARAEPATVVEKSAAEAMAEPAKEAPSADEAAHAARQEERDRRRRERDEARATAAAQAPAGEGAPAAAPAAAEAKPAASEAKPAPAADGAVPSQPTRDQVVAAMNGVLPRIQECVGDKHGQANVTITVRAAGFVSYAIVAGTFVGTPEGSCIARVVKEAQFPPFGEPFIRITYPYQL